MESGFNDNALLRLPQVLELIPISKSSWWQGCKEGKYPKPIKLGPRTTVWKASDVLALVAKITGDYKAKETVQNH